MLKFDDDPKLKDLLTHEQRQRLTQGLSALCGHSLEISDDPQPQASPIEFNLETIAWLTGGNSPEMRGHASELISFLMFFVAKYRLAANMHNDVTEASYAELQRQNEALQVSEAKYRQLSDQLQERVAQQVAIIDKTQQKLYEAARLRSVGHLAAGIAHEINNPIGFISSNLRVAGEYVSELGAALPDTHQNRELLSDFKDLLAESLNGTTRIADIVADLKTFSSVDQDNHTRCNINDLMRSAIHMVQTAHGGQLDIQARFTDIRDVSGYPSKLSQTFFNLLDNAAQAIKETDSESCKGTILVKTRHDHSGVQIIVQDNGGGIPEADRDQIFDAFFTTRPVGSGTGLGLTVARDTAYAHGGDLKVDSKEGVGSRFTLTIPSATES
ncbi:sensor histidine kinase [Marinobacter sediminum]|uniref:sensor histidine kinase n=1 Tax=Marinobacter sediminum TaxID=256323 RepID=UPI0035646A8A